MNWYKKAKKELIPGGKAEGKNPSDFDEKQLEMGTEIEMEHTKKRDIALEIAKDHLQEFPNYYTELNKMEDKLKNK